MGLSTNTLETKATLGPLLIGLLFSAFIFGIIALQAHLYFRSFSKDSILTRVLVACLVVMNIIHLGFISHAQYYYLITNFWPSESIAIPVWTMVMSFTVSALAVFTVQCYYAWKFWIFSGKNVIFAALSVLLPLARLGVSVAKTVVGFEIGSVSRLVRENAWICAAFGTQLPSDLWITCSMIYFIRRSRKQTNPEEPLFRIVLLYLVHTAGIPCSLTIVALICFLALDNNLSFVAIHFLMGELYTSCMLVMLNSRTPLNGRGNYTASYATSNMTMLSSNVYGKATIRSEATMTQYTQDTSTDDLSPMPSRLLKHISTSSHSNVEFRGKRDRTPGTPISQVPSSKEEDVVKVFPSGSQATKALASVPEDANATLHNISIRRSHSSMTIGSRSTDPNMSWESVETRDMERPGHDIGDIQWDGGALRWHVGQTES